MRSSASVFLTCVYLVTICTVCITTSFKCISTQLFWSFSLFVTYLTQDKKITGHVCSQYSCCDLPTGKWKYFNDPSDANMKKVRKKESESQIEIQHDNAGANMFRKWLVSDKRKYVVDVHKRAINKKV